VLTTLLAFAAAVSFALVRDPTFTTQASFRPQGSEASASQLMALASQFGVNIPGAAQGEEASPAFYAELLTSREILSRIIEREYHVEGMGGAALADLLEVDDVDDEGLRLRRTIEALRSDILTVQTSRETGIVTIEARTEWPDLSLEIARRLLDEIARFNLDTRSRRPQPSARSSRSGWTARAWPSPELKGRCRFFSRRIANGRTRPTSPSNTTGWSATSLCGSRSTPRSSSPSSRRASPRCAIRP
jgi:uncharacterized protein involved in exopolysaccharide biosynthesis